MSWSVVTKNQHDRESRITGEQGSRVTVDQCGREWDEGGAGEQGAMGEQWQRAGWQGARVTVEQGDRGARWQWNRTER